MPAHTINVFITANQIVLYKLAIENLIILAYADNRSQVKVIDYGFYLLVQTIAYLI